MDFIEYINSSAVVQRGAISVQLPLVQRCNGAYVYKCTAALPYNAPTFLR